MLLYGHPGNRFWKVTAAVFGDPVPETTKEKKAFLLRNRVAVWDVIESCEITGSADSTIRNVRPNDLSDILQKAKIETIYLNGKTAERYYRKYLEKTTPIPAVTLPSTSPANAAYSVEKLTEAWKVIGQ